MMHGRKNIKLNIHYLLLKLPSVACLTTPRYVEVVSSNKFTLSFFSLSRYFLINNGAMSKRNASREIQEISPP